MKCKHKFEARYDEGMNLPRADIQGGTAEILKQFRYKKYVYDICVKCGKKIKRGWL